MLFGSQNVKVVILSNIKHWIFKCQKAWMERSVFQWNWLFIWPEKTFLHEGKSLNDLLFFSRPGIIFSLSCTTMLQLCRCHCVLVQACWTMLRWEGKSIKCRENTKIHTGTRQLRWHTRSPNWFTDWWSVLIGWMKKYYISLRAKKLKKKQQQTFFSAQCWNPVQRFKDGPANTC